MVHVHPNVLLVNDHPDVTEGLWHVLQMAGYKVETAQNGREALQKLYGGLRPCLILLDLMMPVMTGFEFREEQMRLPEFADIPVIVFSGITDPGGAAQLQAHAYLQLPAQNDRLVELVRQHCLK